MRIANRFLATLLAFTIGLPSMLLATAPRAYAECTHPVADSPGDGSEDPRDRDAWFTVQRGKAGGYQTARTQATSAPRRALMSAGSMQPARWTNLGPSPISSQAYSGGIAPASGRVSSLVLNGTGTIYAGAAGGGVWSSTNDGASWTPLTDQQPSLAMGAMAVDPNHPNVIYAGTGEPHNSSDSFYGTGLLKSTDGGATWSLLGSSIFSGTYISAVVVAKAPVDGTVIYVGTSKGLFKTTNSGQNWTRLAPVTGNSYAQISDLVTDPTNPLVLYAAAVGYGIYKTTDGSTWTQLSALPTGSAFGTTALAIAPTQANTIYASVASNQSLQFGAMTGVYKSTDAGALWTKLNTAPDVFSQSFFYGSGSGFQGWYDNTIAVSPLDPNTVVIGGIGLTKTTDGGLTWSTDLARGKQIHPDQHAVVFDAQGNLYIGNDGGVWKMRSDGIVINLNANLSITQFYPGISVDGTGTRVMGGAQDNGSSLYNGSLAWNEIYGGDGGFTALDPNTAQVIYVETQNGSMHMTIDGGAHWTSLLVGNTSANWVAPFILVPDTPANTLYFGGDNVYKSTNGGTTWTKVTQFSGTDKVSALTVAPSNHNVVYAGWNSGRVTMSDDGGTTWKDISPNTPYWITSITVSPTNPYEVYLTFSGDNFPQYAPHAPHVLMTMGANNATTTSNSVAWADITGNLPDAPANALVMYGSTSLIVASDVGVFMTTDRQNWTSIGQDLPNVQVADLKLTGNGTLIAATHGRGMWQIPLGAPPVAPTVVTGVTPNTGMGGQTVTITGSGFTGTTAVTVGSFNARSYKVNSDTSITAVAPSGSGAVDVQVTALGGRSAISSNDKFTYQTTGPVITAITPVNQYAGRPVTLTGTNFGTPGVVVFTSTDTLEYGSSVSWAPTNVVVNVPSLPFGNYNVFVSPSQGPVSNQFPFTITAPVVVMAVTPNAGTIGSSLSVTGSGFDTGAGSLVFHQGGHDYAATVTGSWSDTSLAATVPVGLTPGAASLTVNTQLGLTSQPPLPFTVVGGPDSIKLTPATANVLADNQATVVLSGKVLDVNNIPIAGVAVDLTASRNSLSAPSTVTAADGTFSVVWGPTGAPGPVAVTATVQGSNPALAATANLIATPPTGAKTVMVTPADISVAAGQTLTIAGRVMDGINPVPNQPVTLTTSGGSLSLTSVTTQADGSFTTTLTAPLMAGSVTITAQVAGALLLGTATVSVLGAAPVAITANAATKAALGVTVAVTGLLTDANGNPVQNDKVIFLTTGGTLSAPSAMTGVNGMYTVTLTTPTTPSTVTVNATVPGTNVTAHADIVMMAPAHLTLAPQDATVATGGMTILSGVLTGGDNSPLAGGQVTLTGLGAFGAPSVTTAADGTFSSTYTAPTVPGPITITATAGALAQTATVTVVARPAAAVTLLPASANAISGTAVVVNGLVSDPYGNPVAGATVNLTATSGSFGQSTLTTATDGTYTANFMPSTAGVVTLTATVAGVTPALIKTATVTVASGSAKNVTLMAGSTSATSGTALAVNGLVSDQYGNTVAGATVNLSAPSGSFNQSSLTTAIDGTYTANFTPTTAGSVTLTATIAGVTPTLNKTFTLTVGAGAPAALVLTAPSSLTAGTSGSVSVHVTDAVNNPVSGAAVGLVTTAGSLNHSQVTTGPTGDASATYTAPASAASITITATLGALTKVTTITVAPVVINNGGGGGGGYTPPTPVPTTITLNADATTVLTGDSLTVMGIVKDALGKPMSSTSVSLTITAGTLDSASVTTAADGSFSAKVTAPADPGTLTVTAKAGTIVTTATVTVKAKPASVRLVTIEGEIEAGQTRTISGTVTDTKGRPVAGAKVDLSASIGTISPATVITGTDGGFSAQFTAPDESCSATISARVNDLSAGTTLNVIKFNVPKKQTKTTVVVPVDTGEHAVTISTTDNAFQLTMPKGSMPDGTKVTVTAADHLPPAPAGARFVSLPWSIDTEGKQPTQPVKVQIHLELPAGVSPENLGLYLLVNGSWQFFSAGTFDPKTNTLTATLPHFSDWAVMSKTVSYSDVSTTHWAYQAINTLSARGVASGFPDGSFQPEGTVTRAQFMKLLLSSLGIQPKVAATPVFSDVPAGAWYEGYMDEAHRIDLLQGSGGMALPEAPITRQEAAVLLVRAMFYAHLASGTGTMPATMPTFTDQDLIAPWALEAAGQAAVFGVMKGYPDGTFAPRRVLTRAEGVSLASRIIVLLDAKQSGIPQ